MIEKVKILELVQDALSDSDKFLVNLKITTDNRIYIDLDGDSGITIDDCIAVSRAIENNLDREEEDFELNVSSAGADSPLKLPRQYKRHVGRDIWVETTTQEGFEGKLTEADDNQITVKTKGTKKSAPKMVTIAYNEIKTAKIVIKF